MGSRLRPHTHTRPKPLLPVAGQPILGHILAALQSVYENVEYSYPGVEAEGMGQAYNSSTGVAMGREELRGYLRENRLLEWG